MAERVEALVQHAREGEVRFRTFHVHLNEFFLDVRHFLVEIVCGREPPLQLVLTRSTQLDDSGGCSPSFFSLFDKCLTSLPFESRISSVASSFGAAFK